MMERCVNFLFAKKRVSNKQSLFACFKGIQIWGGLVIMGGFLLGCQSHTVVNNELIYNRKHEFFVARVIDYQLVNCNKIWSNDDLSAFSNSLFWLRVMDCSVGLTNEKTKYLIENNQGKEWFNIFKRGILLTRNNNVSINKLQQIVKDNYQVQANVPLSLLPLYNFWLSKIQLSLQIKESNKRYQQNLVARDLKIDALKERKEEIKNKLDEMTKKLSSLADIERQLSSRKHAQSDKALSQELLQKNKPIVEEEHDGQQNLSDATTLDENTESNIESNVKTNVSNTPLLSPQQAAESVDTKQPQLTKNGTNEKTTATTESH